MSVYKWFSFLLVIINITIDHHHTHVPEQHRTYRLEATDTTIAFHVVTCLINSTNTTFVKIFWILEKVQINFMFLSLIDVQKKMYEKRFHLQ